MKVVYEVLTLSAKHPGSQKVSTIEKLQKIIDFSRKIEFFQQILSSYRAHNRTYDNCTPLLHEV